jgi:hypothetical protein
MRISIARSLKITSHVFSVKPNNFEALRMRYSSLCGTCHFRNISEHDVGPFNEPSQDLGLRFSTGIAFFGFGVEREVQGIRKQLLESSSICESDKSSRSSER